MAGRFWMLAVASDKLCQHCAHERRPKRTTRLMTWNGWFMCLECDTPAGRP